MRTVEEMEALIASQTDEWRLENIKAISYFVQCAATMRKAEDGGFLNPLLLEIEDAESITIIEKKAVKASDRAVLE